MDILGNCSQVCCACGAAIQYMKTGADTLQYNLQDKKVSAKTKAAKYQRKNLRRQVSAPAHADLLVQT